MPPERTWRVRQKPISCDSCRKKKLKCDRNPRCSNCLAREIPCHYQGRPQSTLSAGQLDASSTIGLHEENKAIKDRLQRLEAIVLQHQSHQPGSEASLGALPPTSYSTQGTPTADGVHMDSHWLDAAGTVEASALPNLTDPFTWHIVTLPHIVDQARATIREPFRICMPPRDQSIRLAESYMEHVEPLQHFIHLPTIMPLLHRVYDALEREAAVDPNELAFLLAMLASIAGYWSWDGPASLFALPEDAYSVSVYYVKFTLDVLEQARRLANTRLETVQTHIMIIFVLFRMDSFSAKTRYIHMNAITAAKDLGLHIIDAKDRRPSNPTREEIIDTEIRRRVWWHLCSTDWCLPLLGGSEEATYTIDPRRMRVKKPRNINDQDLETQALDFERPASELTTMSYYLHRIRLGETCREVSDIMWAWGGNEPIPYDWVLSVDKKFDDLSDTLPAALRFEHPGAGSSLSPDDITSSHLHPTLAVQRSFTRLTTQARRAKLHLPFLLRVAQDRQYTYSREKCLQSARLMLSMRHLLPATLVSTAKATTRTASSSPSSPHPAPLVASPHIRLSGVLHHFFIAVVVLVMDLCVNRNLVAGSAGEDEDARKAEIRDACAVLERAKTYSEPAGMFLDSLAATMKRHQLRISQKDGGGGGGGDGKGDGMVVEERGREGGGHLSSLDNVRSNVETRGRDVVAKVCGPGSMPPSTGDSSMALDGMDFETMWKDYFDFDMESMMPADWDALFNELTEVP